MREDVENKMFDLIGKKSSSQDVSSFCRENSIAKASYYYWLKKLRDQPQKDNKAGFVPLSILPAMSGPLIAVQLPSGAVIHVFHREAFSFIESIIG
jgi:hypothetical protein